MLCILAAFYTKNTAGGSGCVGFRGEVSGVLGLVWFLATLLVVLLRGGVDSGYLLGLDRVKKTSDHHIAITH
ncbi:MAG: hypothetical protein VXW65_03350 [Pseudomonadota bacterium]|nr:hypothetical protein [Pseudomonadota bacterium]